MYKVKVFPHSKEPEKAAQVAIDMSLFSVDLLRQESGLDVAVATVEACMQQSAGVVANTLDALLKARNLLPFVVSRTSSCSQG